MRSIQPGERSDAEYDNVLEIKENVFDVSALTLASAAIVQLQPGAKVVALMSEDRGLYKAQNAMFDAAAANKDNRDYLLSLLEDREVSHLVLRRSCAPGSTKRRRKSALACFVYLTRNVILKPWLPRPPGFRRALSMRHLLHDIRRWLWPRREKQALVAGILFVPGAVRFVRAKNSRRNQTMSRLFRGHFLQHHEAPE